MKTEIVHEILRNKFLWFHVLTENFLGGVVVVGGGGGVKKRRL